jgi:hypothetical protein
MRGRIETYYLTQDRNLIQMTGEASPNHLINGRSPPSSELGFSGGRVVGAAILLPPVWSWIFSLPAILQNVFEAFFRLKLQSQLLCGFGDR